MLQSNMNKRMDVIKKTDISLATKIDPSTSCAPFDMQWSWLAIWGKEVVPDTGYALASMAKQLNSASVKK